ncbi:MAG: hypothetical protein U0793_17565 [Gemmataceae bacterium]
MTILHYTLEGALLVLAIGGFFALIQHRARRPPLRDPETGELVLQFAGFLVWTMALIAVLGPVLMIALSFVVPFKNEA